MSRSSGKGSELDSTSTFESCSPKQKITTKIPPAEKQNRTNDNLKRVSEFPAASSRTTTIDKAIKLELLKFRANLFNKNRQFYNTNRVLEGQSQNYLVAHNKVERVTKVVSLPIEEPVWSTSRAPLQAPC